MTDQETHEMSRTELREQNLEWFARQFPAIHHKMMNLKALSELIDEGEGWYNLRFSGQLLYEPSAQEYIEGQAEGFKKNPRRMLIGPPQPNNFDRHAGNFLHRFLEHFHKDEIEVSLHIPSMKGYFLFVFGFGLGGHINKLVEESDCQCLVIVEPNIEFLAQSLEVFDWKKLHETMDARGGHLDLFHSDRDDELFNRIKGVIRTMNPTSFDGSLLYTHYGNSMFEVLVQRISVDAHIIMSGLGFYFDETVMINNTHANLSGGNASMMRFEHKAIRSYPAFIIGSGPSLDKDIEWIKENQENAIVFACGSAIMPLMRAGIQPDYQVELENVPELYPMMLDTVKYIDLSKVHLLTSTTVDARVPGFFDNTSYFFRPALSSYPIFARADDQPLHNGSPSVTNAGLAIAQHLGFRDFYLFGADMGSKTQGLAHSKNAWQNCDEGWEVEIKFDLPIRGNFGGTVYTYKDMNWTRDELEQAIKALRQGRHYYNCSDGAYIKGTVAKHSRSIKFKDQKAPKSKEVQDIANSFAPYPKDDFLSKWNDLEMQEHFIDYTERLLKCMSDAADVDSKLALTNINRQLSANKSEGLEVGLSMLFRGSVWQALYAAEYYLIRVDGEEQHAKALAIYMEEVKSLILYLRKKSIEDLGFLTEQEWVPMDREIDVEVDVWD